MSRSKVLDLSFTPGRDSSDIGCGKAFDRVILNKKDEQMLYKRPPLEETIIDTVSRYFNGNGARAVRARSREDQFLLRTLQKYFQGSTTTLLKF